MIEKKLVTKYGDKAKDMVETVKEFAALFGGRARNADGMMDMSMDLVVALRDVAGLAWGGIEMSHTQNGDFMHFDCRNTDFGQAVYSKMAPKPENADEQKTPAKKK